MINFKIPIQIKVFICNLYSNPASLFTDVTIAFSVSMTTGKEIMMKKGFLTAALLFSISAVAVSAQEKVSDKVSVSSGKDSSGFVIRSPAVANGGTLPMEFTGDGAASTLSLEWNGAPSGTKSYALIMHHVDPEGKIKWYWVLYNIPETTHSLPKNVKDVGTLGNNSVNERTEYAPPHSKGPGPKTYIYTIYALSASLQINVSPEKVNRDVLLAAMKDKILASGELHVVYSRPEESTSKADDRRPPQPPLRQIGDR